MNDKSHLQTDKLEQGINMAGQGLILSRSPDKAMQEMMEVITQLRGVYTEENEVLLRADTRRFLAMQDDKVKAAREYQSGAKQMIARKGEFKEANPALRQQLIDMQEDFSVLTTENLEALGRMRKGVQRLGDRIMNAARKVASEDTPNYKSSGTLNKNERALSIGLNESA